MKDISRRAAKGSSSACHYRRTLGSPLDRYPDLDQRRRVLFLFVNTIGVGAKRQDTNLYQILGLWYGYPRRWRN